MFVYLDDDHFDDDKPELEDIMHYGVLGMKWGVRKERYRVGSKSKKKDRINETIKDRINEMRKDISADSRNDDKKLDLDLISAIASTAYGVGSMAFTIASVASKGVSILNAAQLVVLSNPISTISLAVGTVALTKRAVKLLTYKSKIAKYDKERENEKRDKKTGLLKQNTKMSQEEDMKRVNPAYGNFKAGSKNNCFLCSIAYDLRRRGYDVRAKSATEGYFNDEISKFYPKAKQSAESKDLKRTISEIKAQGDGARGSFFVQWSNGGGHSIAYEVKNGKFELFDCQTSKHYNETAATFMLLKDGVIYSYARTDNCDFDAKNVKLVVD